MIKKDSVYQFRIYCFKLKFSPKGDSSVSVVGSGSGSSWIEFYSTIEVGLNRQKWADCHPNSVLYILEGQC